METEKRNLILLLVIFLLVASLLILLSINNKLNYTLQANQRELNRLKEDNKILFLKIESANDLEEISRRAEQELGMIFPNKIEYIYDK